jgi:CheY-like chemotaxis protein
VSGGLGQGATFTLELPLAEVAATTAPETPAAEIPAAAETGAAAETAEKKRRPDHLLLVEDHADTAAAFAELLGASGYQVTVAGSVAEGLRAAGRGGIDLVISDLGLPDGHGHELMREIVRRHGLPGIALSGYGMEEDVRQSLDAGFLEHLIKPINLDHLKAVVERVVAT